MRRLTDEELERAIAYRPYVRGKGSKRIARASDAMNWLLCVLTFVGGSIYYEEYRANLPPKVITAPGYMSMEPNGDMPPLSDEEFRTLDWHKIDHKRS